MNTLPQPFKTFRHQQNDIIKDVCISEGFSDEIRRKMQFKIGFEELYKFSDFMTQCKKNANCKVYGSFKRRHC